MKIRKTAAGLCLVCLAGLLAAGCGNGAAPKESPDQSGTVQSSETQQQEGKPGLRSFSAETLDGGTFTQDDLAAVDLTMVNFWGTFCSPCIAEMPDLAEFAGVLPENVQLITICVDGEFAKEDARTLLDQAGFEGITLTKGDGDYEEMLENILAVPTTLFLDAEGNVVGDVVEGGGLSDFSGFYLEKINEALLACGKEEISLAE